MEFTIDIDGVTSKTGVMLDAQWRWVHTPDYETCGDSAGDAAFNEACLIQGLDSDTYKSSYGISVDPEANAVTLKYASVGNFSGAQPTYGNRMFLTDLSSNTDEGGGGGGGGAGDNGSGGYRSFDLLGKEISFTADLSQVPPGMNAAVYLVSMDRFGNLGQTYPDGSVNQAGWKVS